MNPDTSERGRGLSPEQREQARAFMREAGRRAARQLPGILEAEFLRQLHELLEDLGAEISYRV